MNAPLVPCRSCARHVYADSAMCPFCATARTPERLAYVAYPRMSRSAMAALGAVLTVVPAAALLSAAEDAAAQPHHTAPRPRYGLPPDRHPTAPPAPHDAGTPTDAAARPDATSPTDARRAAEAARRRERRRMREEANLPVPLYGMAPKSDR